MNEAYTDIPQKEEDRDRDEDTFTLISIEDYYDLLMEQQEQM